MSAVEGAGAVKEEGIKEEAKESPEAGVKLEAVIKEEEDIGGGGEGDLSGGPGGSPDSGPGSEGVKLDLKGKSDQVKISELQKVNKIIWFFWLSKSQISYNHRIRILRFMLYFSSVC